VSTVPRATVLLILIALATGGCGGSGDASGGAPTSVRTTTARHEATPSPTVAGSRVAWTRPKLLRHLAGRRIVIGGRVIRVDGSTVTCGGIGRPAGHRRDEPVWRRFRCVQPTFPPGSVAGPDAILIVQPVDRTRLVVTERRMTTY
jgi:hypothetical protein